MTGAGDPAGGLSGRQVTGRQTFSPAMESASRYSGWILERLRSHLGAAALEVGFGHSGFRALLPQGVRYAGLDLDEDVVRQARAAAPHDLFVRGDICDGRLGEQLAGFRPDSILCINVLEHVSDDRQAVRVLLSILPDHGCLLILVPALPWLYNRLDRLAGHHRRYSRAGLAALIAAGGGRIARLDYFNPLGVITWPLAGLWPRTSLADPGIQSQVRFFDRYLVPPSRLLDPWCRRIVGQSLIAVVQPPRPPSGSC